MNIKYLLGVIASLPLLPFMYYQGKKIRKSVPKLPEAEGTTGFSSTNKPAAKSLKMLTIGESTIAGVGVKTHEYGFTGTLAKTLTELLDINIDWKVYARSGYTAKRIAKKMIPRIVERDIDLIVIGLGGNDAFTLNTPGKWRKHIIELIQLLKTKFPDTPIVFLNMPPIKEFPAFTPVIKWVIGNLVEILGDELQKIVSTIHNVYFYYEKINLKDWMNRLDLDVKSSDFFSDGVHPSRLTYQTWAKDIAFKISNEKSLILKLAESNCGKN